MMVRQTNNKAWSVFKLWTFSWIVWIVSAEAWYFFQVTRTNTKRPATMDPVASNSPSWISASVKFVAKKWSHVSCRPRFSWICVPCVRFFVYVPCLVFCVDVSCCVCVCFCPCVPCVFCFLCVPWLCVLSCLCRLSFFPCVPCLCVLPCVLLSPFVPCVLFMSLCSLFVCVVFMSLIFFICVLCVSYVLVSCVLLSVCFLMSLCPLSCCPLCPLRLCFMSLCPLLVCFLCFFFKCPGVIILDEILICILRYFKNGVINTPIHLTDIQTPDPTHFLTKLTSLHSKP